MIINTKKNLPDIFLISLGQQTSGKSPPLNKQKQRNSSSLNINQVAALKRKTVMIYRDPPMQNLPVGGGIKPSKKVME